MGHVTRILAGREPLRPLQISLDGDLLLLIQLLISARGEGSTLVSKVKGHADEGLVRRGQVRLSDKIGNDLADEAADHGRRGAGVQIDDARKDLLRYARLGTLLFGICIGFFVAISWAVVNDDGKGGNAPDPMVWCAGARPKKAQSHGSG